MAVFPQLGSKLAHVLYSRTTQLNSPPFSGSVFFLSFVMLCLFKCLLFGHSGPVCSHSLTPIVWWSWLFPLSLHRKKLNTQKIIFSPSTWLLKWMVLWLTPPPPWHLLGKHNPYWRHCIESYCVSFSTPGIWINEELLYRVMERDLSHLTFFNRVIIGCV